MTTFDSLAQNYDAGRTGYANDLYDALVAYGLNQSMTVLDVGCGTGLGAEPLIANGFRVTGIDPSEAMIEIAREKHPEAAFEIGLAERLPFEDHSYGAAISAQSFHHFDRTQALREMIRVLMPRGILAIWWKRLMTGDPVKSLRDEIMRDMNVEPPSSVLTGGFKEFYAATLADHTLRVIPWRVTVTVARYISYERSRKAVLDALGRRSDEYFAALESRLRAHFGGSDAPMTLGYMHYLYLGKAL